MLALAIGFTLGLARVDGDTLLCLIDLGFYTHKEERLRLARIDTPELRGVEKEEGKRVKQIVTDKWPPDTILQIESKKRDNYGRFITEIWYVPTDHRCFGQRQTLLLHRYDYSGFQAKQAYS